MAEDPLRVLFQGRTELLNRSASPILGGTLYFSAVETKAWYKGRDRSFGNHHIHGNGGTRGFQVCVLIGHSNFYNNDFYDPS